MKKTFLLSVLFLSFSVISAHADVLLVEDFEYDYGEILTDHGWYDQYGADTEITTTSGLLFDGYAGCGVGNAAAIDAQTNNPLHKDLSRQITSGSVYVAFMLESFYNDKLAYFLAFREEVSQNNWKMNGRVYVDDENHIGLSFSKEKTTAITSNEVLDPNKVYLVVMKYTINAGDNNDEASLYLLDKYSATEPSSPTLGPVNDASQPDLNPAILQLRGDNNKSYFVIDGIRVATTWSEAVAAGVCPKDEGTAVADLQPEPHAVKVVENGNLYILHHGKRYNALGKQVE